MSVVDGACFQLETDSFRFVSSHVQLLRLANDSLRGRSSYWHMLWFLRTWARVCKICLPVRLKKTIEPSNDALFGSARSSGQLTLRLTISVRRKQRYATISVQAISNTTSLQNHTLWFHWVASTERLKPARKVAQKHSPHQCFRRGRFRLSFSSHRCDTRR